MDREMSVNTIEDDGFEMIDDHMPRRHISNGTTLAEEPNPNEAGVQLHPMPDNNAMIVSVHPPLKPLEDVRRVSCDIVLSIDVSGSMGAAAPLPTTDETGNLEKTGLSVLDLTKHAARTIIQTLNEKDRLGVVTFSSQAKVVHNLSYMTEKSKKRALQQIEALQPLDSTNLWHGLKEGLQVLEKATSAPENVQALYVLTDGKPNHMCPKQGYVPKLNQILHNPQTQNKQLPSIHTFGFGYTIRSGLLQSIAEVGAGTYSFIPDAGMIGTVFVHAVANLYTTFATHATLTFRTTESVAVDQKKGSTIEILHRKASSSPREVSIKLGNLQYGQSRDILLHYEDMTEMSNPMQAQLTYNFHGSTKWTASDERAASDTTSLPSHVCDYHSSRARICTFLRSLFPLREDEEHVPLAVKQLPRVRSELEALIGELNDLGHTDEQNASLLQDLAGEDPHGQVRLALSTDAHYTKWGHHYLLSLLNAHTHQICNSFKDPGPLQYGKNSPLFSACRQELDNCFDNLPAPKPSIVVRDSHGTPRTHHGHAFSMARYNRSSNPCFAGHCQVRLPKGCSKSSITIRDLRPGMAVWTPRGARHVKAVVATAVRNIVLCNIGSLQITSWHPIQSDGRWLFPWEVSDESTQFSGTIYSVLLAPSPDPEAHALMVGESVCVSLGHGIQAGNDARAHGFFGSYAHVMRSLKALPRGADGVLKCSGMKRHAKNGLVCGFVGRGSRRVGRPGAGGSSSMWSKSNITRRPALVTRLPCS